MKLKENKYINSFVYSNYMRNNKDNMKLDLLDRKILYELDLDSRISFKALGKKLRVAKETIGFRIKKLVGTGYIKHFLTTINVSNTNRFYYKLLYKFHRTTIKIDEEIINFIKNWKEVAYFASLEGRYDVAFLILSKDMQDLRRFLTVFRSKFGGFILEQEILTITNVHRFNFRFFYDDGKLLHTEYSEQLKESKLDVIDYQIMKILANNSRASFIEIGNTVKTTPNAVKYRVRKLKEMNVLGSTVLDISFDKFDIQHIQVDFAFKNPEVMKQIIANVSQFPQSTFAATTLGKYDLAVEFAVKDTKELRNILNKIKEKFSDDITNYDVFIMEEHKINWFPYELNEYDNNVKELAKIVKKGVADWHNKQSFIKK